MAATATKTTEPLRVGRFDVVYCDDADGQGWEIREGEDVLDCEETRRSAIASAKRMEADRLQDEADQRQADEDDRRSIEADAIHTRIQKALDRLQERADTLNGESKVEALEALLASLKAI